MSKRIHNVIAIYFQQQLRVRKNLRMVEEFSPFLFQLQWRHLVNLNLFGLMMVTFKSSRFLATPTTTPTSE